MPKVTQHNVIQCRLCDVRAIYTMKYTMQRYWLMSRNTSARVMHSDYSNATLGNARYHAMKIPKILSCYVTFENIALHRSTLRYLFTLSKLALRA